MEWGFLPDDWFGEAIDTREKAWELRHGGPVAGGKKYPPITFLNAMAEELLLPYKKYRDSALHRRAWFCQQDFSNGDIIFYLENSLIHASPLLFFASRIYKNSSPLRNSTPNTCLIF